MRIAHLSKRSVVVGLLLFASMLGAFLAGRALAGGIPAIGAMTYAGTLQDAGGAVLTGDHNIEVKLWSMVSGGTNPLCATGPLLVTLDGGRFSVALPDDCTNAVKSNSDTWADVLVDGGSLGRTKLGAVPYAVEAGHATAADNATSATNAANVPVITEWQTYAPVMKTNADAVVTAATSTGRYRRVGDSAEVIIQTKFSSTPSTGASWYHWTLPAGLVIDTAKQTTGGPTIGAGAASGTSVNQQTDLNIYVRTSSTVSAGGTGFWYVNDSTPLTFAANFQFDLYFTVPIVGWTTTQ